MRRKVLLSSLTVGRCFTLALEPGGTTEESPKSARRGDSIVTPESAWKVVDVSEEATQAQNAKGEEQSFAPGSEVVEIPRQGFERLAT